MGILKKNKIKFDLTKGQEQFFDKKSSPTPIFTEIVNMVQDNAGKLIKSYGFERTTPKANNNDFVEIVDVINDGETVSVVGSTNLTTEKNKLFKSTASNVFTATRYNNSDFDVDQDSIVKLHTSEETSDTFSSIKTAINQNNYKCVLAIEYVGGNLPDSINLVNIKIFNPNNKIIFTKNIEIHFDNNSFALCGYSGGFYILLDAPYDFSISNGVVTEVNYPFHAYKDINFVCIAENDLSKVYFTSSGNGAVTGNPDSVYLFNKAVTAGGRIAPTTIGGGYYYKYSRMCYYNSQYYIVSLACINGTNLFAATSFNINTVVNNGVTFVTSGNENVPDHFISNQNDYSSGNEVSINCYTQTPVTLASFTETYKYIFSTNTITSSGFGNGLIHSFFAYTQKFYDNIGSQKVLSDFDALKTCNGFLNLINGCRLVDVYQTGTDYYITFKSTQTTYIAKLKQNKFFENKTNKNYFIDIETGKSINTFYNDSFYQDINFLKQIANIQKNLGGPVYFTNGTTYQIKTILRYKNTILLNPEPDLTVFTAGVNVDAVDIECRCFYGFPNYIECEDLYVDFYVKETSNSVYFYSQSNLFRSNNPNTYRLFANANLTSNKTLDTTISSYMNGFSFIKKLGKRNFCGNGKAISYSNIVPIDETFNFKKGYLFQITHPANGKFIQIDKIDEKLILFAEDGIYVCVGDGLNDDATGQEYSTPQKISDNVIVNKYSVQKGADAIVCCCTSGIYLIDRGLNISLITGVFEYGNIPITPTDSFYNNKTDEIKFLTGTKNFVYSCRFKTFYSETVSCSRGAFVSGIEYACSNDKYLLKRTNTYLDGILPRQCKFTTGWLKFADISGFGRLYKIILHLYSSHKHTYSIKILYDYNESLIGAETHTFTQTKDGNDFIIEVYSNKQKCESFKIIFEEDVASQNQVLGDDLQIIGIDAIIGIKPSENKVSVAERA